MSNTQQMRKSRSRVLRWQAAQADYNNKRDLFWARTDNNSGVSYWAERQEEDREQAK